MRVRNTNEEIDKLFLNMLCELNVDSISLYIFEPNYRKYYVRYNKLIEMIKEREKRLILNAYTFPRKNESFDEFFERLLRFKPSIVERYKPDSF
ncbi:MAG: hypothetical protein DRJ64_07445 [Thermoprotei archaeon]|nr:MAG: hypothetical protein DRJ64_07445 [Thermoprotei archaeon]